MQASASNASMAADPILKNKIRTTLQKLVEHLLDKKPEDPVSLV